MAGNGFAGGVEAEQLGGDFAGGALGAILDALPLGAAEAGQSGRVVGGGDVCAEAVELFGGNIEAVVVRVFEDEVLTVFAGGFEMGGSDESGDAVVDVDDVAAGGEVGQGNGVAEVAADAGRAVAALLDGAEQLGVAVHRDGGSIAAGVNLPSLAERAMQEINAAGAGAGRQIFDDIGGQAGFLQQFTEASGVLADGDYRAIGGDAGRRVVGEGGQAGEGVGEGFDEAGIFVGTPAEDVHGGDARPLQLGADGFPIGGGRRETVGQFAAGLAGSALLLVPGILFLGFSGEAGRTVQHQDGVVGDVVGQGVGVEQAVVEGQDLGIGVGEQVGQLFLKSGDGRARAG